MRRSDGFLHQTFLSTASAVAMLTLCAVLAPQAANAGATLVVDLDGHGTAADCNAAGVAFSSIQAAVTEAAPGDAVFICPGVYNEQVVVTTNNLEIRGAGVASTVLRPAVVTAKTTTITTPVPVPVLPILLVSGVAGVSVTQLSVDGSLADSGGGFSSCGFIPHFVGIFYRNASGTVEAVHVTNIRSSTVCAFGARLENDGTNAADVVFRANRVDAYGAAGVVCAGKQVTCAITGNTLNGIGPTDVQTQVGIAVRFGAVTRIAGNIITNHVFRPGKGLVGSSVGIFMAFADPASNPHLLPNNSFANNDFNVQRLATAEAGD